MSENIKLKVPEELKAFLEVEHCDDFKINRYYITRPLKRLYRQITELPELAEQMRAMNIDYLNTTLLYGLSGTGKTTFARYIAYRLDLDFAYINFSKLIGANATGIIQDIFHFMEHNKCVFMLDEIDCVAGTRSNKPSGIDRVTDQITVTIMQMLDYYKKHKTNSIILAGTNRVDILDTALLSRFAIKFEMLPLLNEDKEKYLIQYLNDVKVPYDESEIRTYCARNSRLEQRNMEFDMIQGIANWIRNDKQGMFHIENIK